MSEPILYILMRNDLASMNPGKAIAQGSHAASAFHAIFSELKDGMDESSENYNLAFDWFDSTEQGFGTVLVLAVTGDELLQSVKMAQDLGFPAQVIHDPTYPIPDGQVTHYIPLDTCGYIFGDKTNIKLAEIVAGYKLHP